MSQSSDSSELWYVAVHEAQEPAPAEPKGPFTSQELSERYCAGEISKDAYVWKAGMEAWMPLLEVPEFSSLFVAPVASGAGESGETRAVAEVRASSELLALIDEERAKKKPHADAPASSSSGNGLGTSVTSVESLPAVVESRVPHSSETTSWSVPNRSVAAAASPLGGTLRTTMIATVLIAMCLGVGAGATWWFLSTDKIAQTPALALSQKSQNAASTPVVPGVVPLPVEQPRAPSKSFHDDENSKHILNKHDTQTEAARNPQKNTRVHRAAPHTEAQQEPEESPDNAEVKPSLNKDDIWVVVRENASRIAPCLQTARTRGEIAPGQYKFILDWTIRANGSVSDPVLKGPATMLSGSLPACFAAVLSTWRFPASHDGAPVTNFPFGPITVH